MQNIFLSTSYFGSLQYFSKFLLDAEIYIEQHENYLKQSYRNRCEILSANGKLALTIPIHRCSGDKILIRDVRINYDDCWQQKHWRAIKSAYNSSPFLEYYEDDFIEFFETRETFLFDLNMKITHRILEVLEIQKSIRLTENYQNLTDDYEFDYRQNISPKPLFAKSDNLFSPKKYYQVFAEKNGFVANLSIMDLIFNEGPNAKDVLKTCVNLQ